MIVHYTSASQAVGDNNTESEYRLTGKKFQVIEFDANTCSLLLEQAEAQGIEVVIIKEKST